ncbi:hypothetical protein [Methylocystis parvus]|uniref:hypothetical protein n=1 Tax=Methylocystis parvus TaxID=134 RepID=UPI00138ABF1A|nr:hypothetical protein [Methylocystis parvus]WBK02166.1 hypothetical protein MMG94_11285 [Methylocystis parvus OBBP]
MIQAKTPLASIGFFSIQTIGFRRPRAGRPFSHGSQYDEPIEIAFPEEERLNRTDPFSLALTWRLRSSIFSKLNGSVYSWIEVDAARIFMFHKRFAAARALLPRTAASKRRAASN